MQFDHTAKNLMDSIGLTIEELQEITKKLTELFEPLNPSSDSIAMEQWVIWIKNRYHEDSDKQLVLSILFGKMLVNLEHIMAKYQGQGQDIQEPDRVPAQTNTMNFADEEQYNKFMTDLLKVIESVGGRVFHNAQGMYIDIPADAQAKYNKKVAKLKIKHGIDDTPAVPYLFSLGGPIGQA